MICLILTEGGREGGEMPGVSRDFPNPFILTDPGSTHKANS